jgi:copper chaperone CopZ
MTTTVLNIPDISCDHCARTVTEALSPLEGIRRVSVDVPKQQVRVEYDETQVGVERMKTVLAEEEYPVASVEPATAA